MAKYPIQIISEAENPAVALGDVKLFLREDRNIEDSLLASLVEMAEEALQQETGVFLVDTQFQMSLPTFRDVKLPRAPYQSGSATVLYTDDQGVEQTLPAYKYTIYENDTLARIEFENDLPELSADTDYPVRINFTAGYGATEQQVPEKWKTAIKVLVLLYHRRDYKLTENKNIDPLRVGVIKALISGSKIGRFS